MRQHKTSIPGLLELFPEVYSDNRGRFVKIFAVRDFLDSGLRIDFAEDYYTVSSRNVIRGLHFQTPPHGHAKLVSCLKGEVVDVVVDLRVGSPAYGSHELFRLSGDQANILYIPEGLAHGFYVQSSEALLMYKVTSHHVTECDSGILWNSAGISWPTTDPIVSDRDRNLTRLGDFSSPFIWEVASD